MNLVFGATTKTKIERSFPFKDDGWSFLSKFNRENEYNLFSADT